MKVIASIIFVCFAYSSFSQNPAPALPQSKPIALVGGTIHVGDGKIIQNGTIVFDKGIITAIGDGNTNFDRNNTEILNVAGKSVYPSIIAPSTSIGLIEVGSVRSTADQSEVGQFNPNVHSNIAYNTDSEVIPTVRGNGVLVHQPVPIGGILSGNSTIVEMDGWNWEDATIKKADGIWLNYPAYISRSFNFEELRFTIKKNENYVVQKNDLHKYFSEALAYSEIQNPNPTNLKFESMKGLFDGGKKLYVRLNSGKEAIEAVKFAKQYKIKNIVIVGGGDIDLAVDFLKENNIPVIVSETQRLPDSVDDDVWSPYKLPAQLMKAGLTVGICYDGEYWRVRNLPFIAGMAAGFGMDKEDALKMVTLNNAKILGIDKELGSLEVGKQATIVVSSGDLLDMRTNKVEHAFIRGKKVELDDKQKRLYKKYADKYGLKN